MREADPTPGDDAIAVAQDERDREPAGQQGQHAPSADTVQVPETDDEEGWVQA